MIFRAHKLFFVSALVGVAVCGALGQSQGTVTLPFKRELGPKAVTIDTRTFVPPIRETVRFEEKGERNATLPPWYGLPAETNTLPVGSVANVNRITSGGALFPGIDYTNTWPPDPNFAVGPNHVVCVVNSDIAFFNKATGAKTMQQAMGASGFFSGMGVTAFDFDPKAFYDKVSGRFFVMTLELDEGAEVSKILLAVSDDSDPNGIWRKYRIEAKMVDGSTESWMDYEGFASNKDAVVVSGNMFVFGAGFTGQNQMVVISKAALLNGAAPTINYLKTPAYTVQAGISPENGHDRIYLATINSNTSMKVYALTNLGANPTLTSTNVTVPSFVAPPGSVPSQGGPGISTINGILHAAYHRFGRLYLSHTTSISGSNSQTQIRWYEIDMKDWPTSGLSPAVKQSGNVAGANGHYYSCPSIAVNKFEDITILFTRSGQSIAADIVTAGRKKTDPAGQMGNVKILKTSPASGYNLGRWGDYSNIQVDPVDDSTFYGYHMFVDTGATWNTEVVKWTITLPGGSSGTAVPPTSVAMVQGAFSSGGLAGALASDNLWYVIRTDALTRLGQVGSFEAVFDLAQPVGGIDSLQFSWEGNANFVGASAFLYLYNNNTGQYDQIKAFAVKTTDAISTVELMPFGMAKYMNGMQVKALFRIVAPTRGGATPPPFDFRTDQVKLSAVYVVP